MARKKISNSKKDPLTVEFECSTFFANDTVSDVDEETEYLIRLEEERQARKLIFIASESLQPRPVREVLASVFTNIYSEGYPSLRMNKTERHMLLDYDYQLAYHRRYWDRKYYKGADYADFVEALAQNRATELFSTPEVPPEQIFANVQPLSGAPANNAIYEAFLEPGDTVMGMDLTSGGHLTHGSDSNRSGRHYNIVSYTVNMLTGNIDYDQLKELAIKHRPKMIIAGYSAFPWNIDWKRFREVADAAGGAILMADIAHTAGLVAAGQFNNPIGYADVVVFTTHKTLCGPRGAVILTTDEENARLIDEAVFPGEQGGPHVNNIAAKAVCFKLAMTKEFYELQKKTVDNAKYFADCIKTLGLKLAYGGTDSHLFLIDLKTLKSDTGFPVTGEIATRILDLCGITCNKNTISGDTNAAHPTAIRFGMTWVTQRGINKTEIKRLANVIHRVLTNIKPFRYLHTVDIDGKNDEIGRGKIDFETIEWASQEVDKIVRAINSRIPDFGTGYPHFHNFTSAALAGSSSSLRTTPLFNEHERLNAKLESRHGWHVPGSYRSAAVELRNAHKSAVVVDTGDLGILELTGDLDRVRPFLHEVSTNNMIDIAPGQARRTILLDKKGKFIDDVMVYHLQLKENGLCRFLVTTHPGNTRFVLNWFRCLSDEYILFDETKDLYAKVQGPVIIHELTDQADVEGVRALTSLDIIGPNALKVPQKLPLHIPSSWFDRLADGSIVETKMAGIDVTIARVDYSKKHIRLKIFIHPDNVLKLWSKILRVDAGADAGKGKSKGKSLGLIPAGVCAIDELRNAAGLPDHSSKYSKSKPDGVQLYKSKLKEFFMLSKPYFIGQKRIMAKIKTKQNKKEYTYTPEKLPLRRSCLYDEHKKLGGKLVPFAGWEMPVLYSGTSIQDEHMAVRQTVGLFDVSHMGVFEFRGPYATRFLDLLTTNYVSWLYPGQAHYSYLLDTDGKVIDDIFLYRVGKDHYMMIVNAANAEEDWAWISAVHSKKYVIDPEHPGVEVEGVVEIRNLKDAGSGNDQVIDLALQGPNALKVLQSMTADKQVQGALARLQRGEFVDVTLKGINVRIARTGYTGARIGFEIYLHPKNGSKFWRSLLKTGAVFGIKPTGLGARDSTRTEAGFPLHGHELAGEYYISPIAAGYGAFVKFHKPFFIGRRAALEQAQYKNLELVRFKMDDKGVRVVKTHDPVASDRGEFIGNVTSSVSIAGYQMGLAYVKCRYAKIGTRLHIYPLPRNTSGSDMAGSSYRLGDKTVIPVNATVLPRFPEEGELEEDYQ